MATTTVTINDVDLVIYYDYEPYEPATRHAPAEGGVIEYRAICINGDNVDGMLGGWVMDKVSAAVDEDIARCKREAEEDRAMARAA